MKTHYFQKKTLPTPLRPHHPAVVARAASTTDRTRTDIRRILRGPSLQAKLTVGAPDDVYEQEADRVADEVMRMPEESLQRQALEEEEEDLLQTKEVVGQTPEVMTSVASKIASMQGVGQSLPASERAFFELRFGKDFSQVRIHIGAQATEAARAVNAQAFTVGHDIVFGEGQYSPRTIAGKRLLAHELTHVIQQREAERLRIQRLKVASRILDDDENKCGEYNVIFRFRLDSPAPEKGYLVQQIDKSEFVADCGVAAEGPPKPLPPFWEAWPVGRRQRMDRSTRELGWTDESRWPPNPATQGLQIAAGTIKFFKFGTTGDLGDFETPPNDPNSTWGPGKVPESGDLPSTDVKPSWWDDPPVEGPAKREVMSRWNCCSYIPQLQTSEITVTPNPKARRRARR